MLLKSAWLVGQRAGQLVLVHVDAVVGLTGFFTNN
jgi:hypothetical protein